MIAIVDTTLRDGEQTPGVAFTLDEKLAIARMLDEAGVDYIEAGSPMMGGAEFESVRAIARAGLHARVIAWCRALETDARAALATGASDIHLSLPVSDLMIERKLNRNRAWVLERLTSVARLVTDAGAALSVGAEDATRADEEFILRYALTARDAGAARLRYCDTVGLAEPFSLAGRIERLAAALSIPVEIHTHNDFGLATANALAAVRSGATLVDTTVTGLGERAGNAPLEEVAMALHVIHGLGTNVRAERLRALAQFTAHAARRPFGPSKSIVGDGVFTHESGLHVDGVLKDPTMYEPFAPELVGARRRIVIGKHTGRKALLSVLAEHGVDTAPPSLLSMAREAALRNKGALSGAQLAALAEGGGVC